MRILSRGAFGIGDVVLHVPLEYALHHQLREILRLGYEPNPSSEGKAAAARGGGAEITTATKGGDRRGYRSETAAATSTKKQATKSR